MGAKDADAIDGRALRLTLGANPASGPGGGAEVDGKRQRLYGSFSTRMRTADCSGQPHAGVVTGAFTYANDGSDADGDGMVDNSEIDVEVLCAQPQVLYLTIWTDYDASSGRQSRVSRAVDLRSGKVLSTCHLTTFAGTCQRLTGAEAAPGSVPSIAGFDSSSAYYTYGFDWRSSRVTFWVETGRARLTLWDYRGPVERIPQRSSVYVHNVWHTPDWATLSEQDTVRQPTSPVSAWFDHTAVS